MERLFAWIYTALGFTGTERDIFLIFIVYLALWMLVSLLVYKSIKK